MKTKPKISFCLLSRPPPCRADTNLKLGLGGLFFLSAISKSIFHWDSSLLSNGFCSSKKGALLLPTRWCLLCEPTNRKFLEVGTSPHMIYIPRWTLEPGSSLFYDPPAFSIWRRASTAKSKRGLVLYSTLQELVCIPPLNSEGEDDNGRRP